MTIRAVFLTILLVACAAPAFAQREAAFVPPSQAGGKREGDEIVAATPKTVELGESIVGITKHLSMFFTNYGGQIAKIENISLSADSNVRAVITSNDCEKVGLIKPNDKCAIGLEITPNSPGTWTAELVMVHDAQGRVSRATITGKTAGDASAGQQPGLSLVGANKEQQIDFGDVEAGSGLAVRSVLLANDSPQPLTIKTIDLVGADRGLSVMPKGGCMEGMNVPPGGSCPVTVIWQPSGRGDVSTDLIIQHTGPVGFAIIPVRGKVSGAGGGDSKSSSTVTSGGSGTTVSAASSSGDARAEAAAASLPVTKSKKGRIPPIAAAALFGAGNFGGEGDGGVPYTLRGTAGSRAILAGPDGSMVVAGVGDVLTGEDGMPYRILNVEPTRVTLDAGGTSTELMLQSPSSSYGAGGGSSNNTSGKTPTEKNSAGKSGNSKG